MQTIEYRFRNKAEWGHGPWQEEPDKRQWLDGATGLPCLMVRGSHGALCGYVGVTEGHPLFGVGYSSCPCKCGKDWCDHTPESVLRVHGGITFADFCAEGSEHGICHKVDPGENDRVWWFGFDCAHAGDYSPGYDWRHSGPLSLGAPTGWGGVIEYRDLAYVQAECAALAAQLAALQ
jgi:hypothetical protein